MSVDGLLFTFGSYEWFLHQSIIIWLVLCVIVTSFLCYAGSKLKKADPTKAPSGLVLVVETVAEFSMNVIGVNLKSKTWNYLPFMGTLMFMMVLSNLMGLLGLQTPTSNMSVILTLVVCMIVMIHGTDLKLHGVKGKIKSWCDPVPALLPLNIIGDLAFPISLTFRLFGNMLGGTILVMLLYLFVSSLLPWGAVFFAVTPFIHLYFDVFAAFMQTYIFFTLASFFLSEGADVEEN